MERETTQTHPQTPTYTQENSCKQSQDIELSHINCQKRVIVSCMACRALEIAAE